MRSVKPFSISSLSLLALLLLSSLAVAAEQTTCPVMGGSINKELHADYKGERVYFCCLACSPQFEKDPEKYLQRMKDMGQDPEKIGTSK
ncbi:MAG: YHS domain-containing protein [Desulfocapsa sp.]|jgi:YHS domain-containing protein|nr:YHS domain-containing protein [Desulfocapsa sp.]